MENQHRKIAGYRELSADEIALMNEAKSIERTFNSFIDKLRAAPGIDQRNVSLAQTHGEDAFMRAVRSVAQPERLTDEGQKFERMDAEMQNLDATEQPKFEGADLPAAAFHPGKGMTRYLGTKLVDAVPMNRAAYNKLRGWDLPADENGADDGYLVEYTDKLGSNVEGFQGYVSWSPADVFKRAYKPI